MARYFPEAIPLVIQPELQEYIFRELMRISATIDEVDEQIIIFGSAPPSFGRHELGEIVFNDGTVTSLATVDHWRCSVAGTPGTWITK